MIVGLAGGLVWGVADFGIRQAAAGRMFSRETMAALPNVRAAVVRAKEVFCADSFVIVSQPFHARRALFLARGFGCEAYGYAAEDVRGVHSVKTLLREQLAKMAALLDVVIRRQPKFLGAEEKLPE